MRPVLPFTIIMSNQIWNELKLSSNPEDYFFYVGASSSEEKELYKIACWLILTPISYFKKHRHISDFHLHRALEKVLPLDLGEEGESLFSSHHSPEEVHQALLAAGFKEDVDFSNFCKQHDPFNF